MNASVLSINQQVTQTINQSYFNPPTHPKKELDSYDLQ